MSQLQASTDLTTRVSRVPAFILIGLFALAAYTTGSLIPMHGADADLTERTERAQARLADAGVSAPDAVLVQ